MFSKIGYFSINFIFGIFVKPTEQIKTTGKNILLYKTSTYTRLAQNIMEMLTSINIKSSFEIHIPTNVSKTHADISRPPTPASEQSFSSLSSSLLNYNWKYILKLKLWNLWCEKEVTWEHCNIKMLLYIFVVHMLCTSISTVIFRYHNWIVCFS